MFSNFYQFPVEIIAVVVVPAAETGVEVAVAGAQVASGSLIGIIRSQIDVIQDNVALHPPMQRLPITHRCLENQLQSATTIEMDFKKWIKKWIKKWMKMDEMDTVDSFIVGLSFDLGQLLSTW